MSFAKKILLSATVLSVVLLIGSISTFSPSVVASAPGIVGEYGLDENSGTVINDSSGNSNNGTAQNGPVWSAGKYGSALHFDGVNDHISIPNSPSLNPTNITVSAWINSTASTADGIIVNKGPSHYQLRIVSGTTFRVVIDTDVGFTQLNSSFNFSPNTWYHIAGTYDGSTVKAYVNGTQINSGALTGNIESGSDILEIGARFTDTSTPLNFFKGYIDEVRVYNRALTLSEIQTDMDTPIGGSSTPPSFTITQPQNNSTVAGTTIDVLYSVSGDQSEMHHVNFQLDSNQEVTDNTVDGVYQFTNVAAGAHALSGYLARTDNSQIPNTDSMVSFSNTDPAVTGQWSQPANMPLVGVHASLMNTGEVLMFDGDSEGIHQWVWNPQAGTFTSVDQPDNLFCSGHATLPDGKVFVAGGHLGSNVGIKDANAFNPATKTWSVLPNMNFARWYPSVANLGDGRVLVTSGSINCDTCVADIPEIFDPQANSWTQLTGAQLTQPIYPYQFLLSDGKIISANGFRTYTDTKLLDISSQSWTTVDPSITKGGSALMYRENKILMSGSVREFGVGEVPSLASSYVIDMDEPSPAWRQIGSMAEPRTFHTLTMLPDGNVLATGGVKTTSNTSAQAALSAEVWDPQAENWTQLASAQTKRAYHSTGLLLADGRVLVAGSGRSFGMVDEKNYEVFSPPYLFKGPRPIISSVPSTIQHGTSFTIQTPDAANITLVSLIRPGSVTHTFDMDQRFVPLAFTQGANSLDTQLPTNTNVLIPGYYMLFIVNGSGVPSIARFVNITTSAPSPTPTPTTAPTPTSTPIPTPTPTPTPDIAASMIGYWKMDEASWSGISGEVVDSSGNNNNGTAVNGATTAGGLLGRAGSFDGVNDEVQVSHATSIDPAVITFAAWVNPTNISSSPVVMDKFGSTTGWHMRIANGGSSFRCSISTTSGTIQNNVSFSFANNTWYHLACSYDGANVRNYVNGVLVGSPKAQSGSLTTGSGVLRIGSRGLNYFAGRIDEVKIFDRALTAQEIASLQ
ncbi:MAG: hypothetical protein A2687_04640 [Candidatus Levybacteria bacterium RIFCSPHIGHO2_01_FULL_38_26]|nr:MAG: hypothetical protein A2687_04640 [Candidatus Levybacteria bacterium RIFCSPHIGHO2_01_FULL_38_26]